MRTPIEIVEAFLVAAGNGDLANDLLASDVAFEGPLGPRGVGREALDEGLLALLTPVRALRIRQHVVEGPYVVTLVEVEAGEGVVAAAVCFRLSGGLIKEIRSFYDPRPILRTVP